VGVSAPIVVWGAGAIGGCIGAALARTGREVLLVDRAEEHVQAINRAGLKITGPIESYSVRVRATTPEQVAGAYETVLLCVKGQDTEAATRALKPHLAAEGAVVSVQNGLNERIIAGIVGAERTIGCFVNFGADYQSPGVVMYGGGGAVVVGELDGRRTPRIERIHRCSGCSMPTPCCPTTSSAISGAS
jgi:2-dehydropantoate 2-reductase